MQKRSSSGRTRWLGALIVGAVWVTMPGSAQGQGAKPNAAALEEAKRLNGEADKLRDEGKFGSAIPLAEQALSINDQALGSNHLDVASSLNRLASLYQETGEYVRAEPLFERALGCPTNASVAGMTA